MHIDIMSSAATPTTRDRILNAACRLLEGYPDDKTRMADIARAAEVSRQAVYLHFENRADLLTEALRYRDEQTGLQDRLAPYRAAETGEAKIEAFVAFWADHVPRVQGMARALLALRDSDPAAEAAWAERMASAREGCESCMRHLADEGRLAAPWDVTTATDLFWAMLSIQNWMLLTGPCGWSEQDYTERLTRQALRTFVAPT